VFRGAEKFNQDLSKWVVAKVNNMTRMFFNSAFKRTLCGSSWESLPAPQNAFTNLGSSTARMGCCRSGSYLSGPYNNPFNADDGAGSCDKCPLGRYQNELNDDTMCPGRCPAGKSTATNGTNSSLFCNDCEIGKFSTDQGYDASCQNCPQGFSTTGTGKKNIADCSSCPPGRYLIEENPLDCGICGKGKYQATAHLDQLQCTACDVGLFIEDDGTDDMLHHSCKTCPKGYEVKDLTQCQVCKFSTYQDQSDVTNVKCKTCEANTFISDNRDLAVNHQTASNCMSCKAGKFANAGDQYCESCPAGKETINSSCIDCIPGKFSISVSADPICTDCPAGYYQREEGTPYCLPCLPGEYQNSTGQDSCAKCPVNTYHGTSAATECDACGTGKFSSSGSAQCSDCIAGKAGTPCADCVKGKYRTGSDDQSAICRDCPTGFYQSELAQASCLPCIPGKYQSSTGQDSCTKCPAGKYQDSSGKTACKNLQSGAVVVGDGSTSVIVPHGSKIDELKPSGFVACQAGTIGNVPPNETCIQCPKGKTSTKGALSCQVCAKGKFGKVEGHCENCGINKYQPQDTKASTKCIDCPMGYYQNEEGQSFCKDPGNILPKDCGDDEYWVSNKANSNKPGCRACPQGGSCIGPITMDGVRNLFGWWEIPFSGDYNSNISNVIKTKDFAPCLYPPACLGAPNKMLEDTFPKDEKGNDLATINSPLNSSCSTRLGYRNNSRLCQTCASGYSRTSQSTCISCNNVDGSSKSLIIFLAVLGMFILFVGLNTLRMRSFRSFDAQRRRKSLHSTIKRIMVSHIQMIGIILGLSVPWPQLMEEVLQAASSVGNFAESVNGFECLFNDVDHSHFHNGVLVVTAISPLFFAGCIGLYWFVLVKWFKVLKCGSQIKSGSLCPKKNQAAEVTTPNAIKTARRVSYTDADAFISSAVLLWYLTLPSLLQISTSALKCWEVGGKDYVFIDLEKKCFEGDHFYISVLVACPMVIFYGGILPGFFMLRLHRVGSARLTDPSLMLRWGIIHSGYREKKFWWETVVLLRKYSIILLVTFNNHGEFQVHFALGILIVVLHIHDAQHPFGYRHIDPSNAILHLYEMASLLILLFMLWCASFFSLGVCNHQEGWCTFIGVVVLVSNFAFVGLLILIYAKECCRRNQLDEKVSKFLRLSTSSQKKTVIADNTGSSVGEVKMSGELQLKVNSKKKGRLSSHESMLEMSIFQNTNRDFQSKMKKNPMLQQNDSSRTSDIDIFVDKNTGRKYSYNKTTGVTAWET
jgi:hypothetical protein